MIEDAVYQRLKDDATVGPLVTTGSTIRIHHVLIPQQPTFPALSISRVSTGGRELTHTGTNQSAEPVFQISCWAETVKQAKQLARAVVRCLHGWSGTQGGEKIYRASVINETDLFDTDIEIFQVAVDVEIAHREI